MPIVLVSPKFTQEQYEETVRKLTGGKSRLESPADWPVEGLLAHIAGQGESTFRVVDVWGVRGGPQPLRRDRHPDHARGRRPRATRRCTRHTHTCPPKAVAPRHVI